MSDVALKMTADVAQAQKAIDALNKQVGQLREKLAEVSEQGRRGTREHAEAMGGLEGRMVGVISKYVSWAAVLATVTKGLTAVKQAADEAAEAQRGSRMALGELGQVATSEADFRGLVQKAKDVYAEGGAATLSDASKLVFSAVSAGDRANIGLYSQLRAAGLVERPEVLAKSAATMRAAMGEKETGPTRGIISKAFAASSFAPTRAEELLEASARAGTGAAALGLSDEEVMAATAMAATATGTAERGGSRIASLMQSLQKLAAPPAPGEVREPWMQFDLKDKGLMGMVTEIQKRNLDAGQLIKLFGREEAVDAYRILLQNQAQYGKALTAIRTAEREDEVGKRLGFFKTEPGLVAARQAEEARAGEELSRGRVGTATNIVQAQIDQGTTAARKAGLPEISLWSARALQGIESWAAGLVSPETYLGFREQRQKAVMSIYGKVSPLLNRPWPAREPGSEALGLPMPPGATGAPMVAPVPPAQLQGVQWQGGGGGDSVTTAVNENTDVLRDIRGEIERLTLQQRVGAAGKTGTHTE